MIRRLLYFQGTLIAFAQFAKNKELASKIKLFLALGPVSVTAHMQSPIRYLSGPPSTFNVVFSKRFQIILNLKLFCFSQEFYYTLFGKKAFLPNYSIIKWLADKACNVKVPEHKLCGNILFVLCGPTTYLNAVRSELINGYILKSSIYLIYRAEFLFILHTILRALPLRICFIFLK